MKKVRITVKKGSAGKKFPIFNSPEALYVWLNDPELQASTRLDSSLGHMVSLRPEEVMEVEWIGCEFIKECDEIIRFDEIRLAKTIKIPSLDSESIVIVQSGWTTKDIITFKTGGDVDTRRLKLTSKSKHKFDIEELFISKGLIQDDADVALNPIDIH